MSEISKIADAIKKALVGLPSSGKIGRDVLQPKVAQAISAAGYEADKEDQGIFLPAKMPVWRSKDTCEIVATVARRKIDIVARRNGHPVALIETESDLNDLKKNGVTRRNGHYDVLSIARDSNNKYFDSYKSLERMAAAAYYFHLHHSTGCDTPEVAVGNLSAICSNEPNEHNPAKIGLFLITGSCRDEDRPILRHRLLSLDAQLICASAK